MDPSPLAGAAILLGLLALIPAVLIVWRLLDSRKSRRARERPIIASLGTRRDELRRKAGEP